MGVIQLYDFCKKFGAILFLISAINYSAVITCK